MALARIPAKSGGSKALAKHVAKKGAKKGTLKKGAAKEVKHAWARHEVKHAGKKAPGKKAPGKKVPGKKVPAKKAAKKGSEGLRALTHEFETEAAHSAGTERPHAKRKHADAPVRSDEEQFRLDRAFHHMHRAAAVISLLEEDTGGDLRGLLEHGMELYRAAMSPAKTHEGTAECATGLLRAAEHLSMAGLYEARSQFRVHVPPPSRGEVTQHLRELGPRLDQLGSPDREHARRLCSMARELLRRAEGANHDPHLEYELTMAAEGICSALEAGL